MLNLRRQSMDTAQPFEYHLAADARFSRTNYCDDQVWTLKLGARDKPALALQSQYGGRAGLVSLVPMWTIGDNIVYQSLSYASPPIITCYAPDYLELEAVPRPGLEMVGRFWAMESRASGGEFALSNRSGEAMSLQLDMFGHVGINGRNRKLNVLTMADDTLALHLGQIGEINPVLTLEGASIEVYGGRIISPKIGCRVELAPEESLRIPFVVAGLADMRDSLSVAMNWMSRSWNSHFERIDSAAAAAPKISTGSAAWDRVIDLSYAHLIKSFMEPTEHLPHASIVANRVSNRGWSRRRDGSDHIRAWSGQDPTLAYLAASAMTTIDADLAKGIILNYLSTQDESGFIDRQPGLAGQRQGVLMMPLLARLSLTVAEDTGDHSFLAAVFPALVAFFDRWLHSDMDADGDGVPEWRSERQMGYVAFPTFGRGQPWAQGANVRQMETPDMLAYLISEASALREMAELVGETAAGEKLSQQLSTLEARLDDFWVGSRYAYRDRDTHLSSESIELLRGGAGDQEHIIKETLPQPARVVVRVVGGVSQRPNISLRLSGRDKDGKSCLIEAEVDKFLWQNRQGVFTTRQPLSHVESIAIDGLSRVYKIYAHTIDSSRLDINGILPLFGGRLPQDRAEALVKLAMDEIHFMRPNGLTMVSADDRNFDPSNARGGGGIWMFWLSLVGEGMVKSGFRAEATDLFKCVLQGLSRVLEREGKLSQFYHSDEIQGFGEDHHIGGIAPLKLLHDVIGVVIPASDRVFVGGEFTWGEPVTVEQHGVKVLRSAEEIRVDFPSGHSETLPPDAPWQLLRDPAPVESEAAEEALLDEPEIVLPSESDPEGRVIIDLGAGEDNPATDAEPPPAVVDDENSPVD